MSDNRDDRSLGERYLAVAGRMRHASMGQLAEHGLTPAQARALAVIHRAPDGIRPGDLAARLHIAPRSATELVDALEKGALVARTDDPTDRRATLVGVTDSGRVLLAEVRNRRAEQTDQLFGALSATDRAHLDRILRRLDP